jgi:hypothetical protein
MGNRLQFQWHRTCLPREDGNAVLCVRDDVIASQVHPRCLKTSTLPQACGLRCSYGAVLRDMQAQIKEFNKKNGRGVGERPIGGMGGMGGMGGLGGGIVGGLIGMVLNEVVGGGGLLASAARGQTPQLSASEMFELESRVCM